MNKRLSKSVLALVIGSMLIASIYIGVKNNQDKNEIVDISGNRQELGDISIKYQQNKGMYKTTQVNITKDNIDVDKNAKQIPQSYDINKNNEKNRDVLKTAWSKERVYEDDKSIGHVQINYDYDNYSSNNSKKTLTIYVEDKNLENNKINTYNIPIELDYNFDTNIEFQAIPIKYNGDIYLTTAIDIEPNFYHKDNDKWGSKESLLNIYKLDLSNENAELILTKQISKGNEILVNVNQSVAFSNGTKAYFVYNKSKVDEEGKYNTKYELLSYDIKQKDLKSVEIPIEDSKLSSGIYNYSIEGNKATFLSYDNETQKGAIDIYTTTIDINNTAAPDIEKYSIKIEDSKFNNGVEKIRIIDDKIYLIVGAYEITDEVKNLTPTTKTYVYVLDKNTKETLYTGKIKEGKNYYINLSILKEDEK